ncbi:MAG: NrsF family protein [Phenylobacterium sp.]
METDALIQSLSAKAAPVAPGAVARRILIGLGLGAATSTLLMIAWLGVRPDIGHAMATGMFWVKFAYTVLTGLFLMAALIRLSRPGAKVGALALVIAAPLAALVLMALVRLLRADPEMRMPLMMGDSADVCPWRIFVIGLPVLAGAVWAVRGLAPTRLTVAGLAAGGCAGAFGAAIYGFHCNETASPFVALWYTLGIAAVALLGGLAGARWLRWR